MTWGESHVPGLERGAPRIFLVRFDDADPCKVRVTGKNLPEVTGEGPDLFEALATVRSKLEGLAIVLACNGSRVDVHPSGMMRQTTKGRRAYALTMPRSSLKQEVVDIFAPAPEGARLGTVSEQGEWYGKWIESLPREDGSVK